MDLLFNYILILDLLHNPYLLLNCCVAGVSAVLIYSMYTLLLEALAPCPKVKSTGYPRGLLNLLFIFPCHISGLFNQAQGCIKFIAGLSSLFINVGFGWTLTLNAL